MIHQPTNFPASSDAAETSPVAMLPAEPSSTLGEWDGKAAGGEIHDIMIQFHLPIVPPKATSQSAGKRMAIINGRPMFFKNKKAASAEHDYLMLCAPHKPASPISGPVKLQVDFTFPWRKSEPKRRLALGSAPMTTKPDCSNAIKALEDCLTKLGFWHDYGQFADLRVTKAWGDAVGISIFIQQIQTKQT